MTNNTRDALVNTDTEIWREHEGDYYTASIHFTEKGGIGINVGGNAIVMPVREWHKLASTTASDRGGEREALERGAQIADATIKELEKKWGDNEVTRPYIDAMRQVAANIRAAKPSTPAEGDEATDHRCDLGYFNTAARMMQRRHGATGNEEEIEATLAEFIPTTPPEPIPYDECRANDGTVFKTNYEAQIHNIMLRDKTPEPIPVTDDGALLWRKKPVVIEAFLWTGGPDQTQDPVWIIDAIKSKTVSFDKGPQGQVRMVIQTLEGPMFAFSGDWIIRGVKGEIYACKPDVFAMTYEPAALRRTVPGAIGFPNDAQVSDIIAAYRKGVFDPTLTERKTVGLLVNAIERYRQHIADADRGTAPAPLGEDMLREILADKFMAWHMEHGGAEYGPDEQYETEWRDLIKRGSGFIAVKAALAAMTELSRRINGGGGC